MKLTTRQTEIARKRQKIVALIFSQKEGESHAKFSRRIGVPYTTIWRYRHKYRTANLPLEAYADQPGGIKRTAKMKRLAKESYEAAQAFLDCVGSKRPQPEKWTELARENAFIASRILREMTAQ